MSDTYTTFLQEPEPKDREQSIESYLKSRLQSLDRAVAGYTSVSLQGLTGNVDLTPSQAKHRVVKLTGAPSGAVTVRIPHATGANADLLFVNACTSGSSTVTVKSTGANTLNSAGVVLLTGEARYVRHDGESAYGATLPSASGTFTPSLRFGGATSGITYSAQLGRYTRVGDRVDFQIVLMLTSKGSATGVATIAGLPVAASAVANAFQIGYVRINFGTFTGTSDYYIDPSSPTVVNLDVNNNGATLQLTNTNFTNTTAVFISGTYFV